MFDFRTPLDKERSLLDEDYMFALSEKYESQFSYEIIMDCVERSIIHAAKKVLRYPVAFVVWEGITPIIYVASNDNIVRVTVYSHKFMDLIVRNLNRTFQEMKLLLAYTKNKKIIMNKIVTGAIKEIHDNYMDIQLDDADGVDMGSITAKILKMDTPVKERKAYIEGYKLFFYVKNIIIDSKEKDLIVYLSRSSKNFLTVLLKYLTADKFNSYYIRKGKYPIVVCTERKPGYYSKVISDIYIPRKTINDISNILGGERIQIKRLRNV